jgi:hypothetical protein
VPLESLPIEEWLRELLYADDMVLLNCSAAEMAAMLQLMDKECAKCGMCINAAKTVVMSVDRRGADPLPIITLSGGEVAQEEKMKYLGSILTSVCSCAEDVAARMSRAAADMHAHRHIWHDSKLPVRIKMQIYTTSVLSKLLFGAESWVLTKQLLGRLSVFHHDCLRRIMGVSRRDQHPRVVLYAACATVSMEALLRHRRLCYLGAVMRMGSERIPWMVFNRVMEGKRPVGGVKKNYYHMIGADLRVLSASLGLAPAELEVACADKKTWGAKLAFLLKPP